MAKSYFSQKKNEVLVISARFLNKMKKKKKKKK